MSRQRKKHPHYHKNVSHLKTVDVYRVLDLFNVTHPCLQHAVKKLLVPGGRGAGKGLVQDVEEAADSLDRFLEMAEEDQAATEAPGDSDGCSGNQPPRRP